MLVVYVDFNSMMRDEKERVQINPVTNKKVIESFISGLKVLLTDEDIEVEAELEFDEQHKVWFGIPNWATQNNAVEEGRIPHAVR
jgi:hypothetical protein